MNEQYFNEAIDDKKFYHSVLKNCTDRIENVGISFPIMSDESKEELNKVLIDTVWDMFFSYRPLTPVQLKSASIAHEFYNTILNIQDVELSLQQICKDKDLDIVVITELSL
ncbi:hypothetical protein [Clostridium sp.]|uniref:hypothetical protein n=1 Tax=Clostridium sp. TaxID=1506 RepID=UPI003217F2A9